MSNFTVVATISLTKGEGRHEFDDDIKAITIYQAGEISSTANIQVISGDNIALRCKLEAHGTWFLDNDVRQEWEFRDNDAGRETISRNGKKVIDNKRVSQKSGGGVLRFDLDRCVPLEPQNPYPSLRVILAEKGTHF